MLGCATTRPSAVGALSEAAARVLVVQATGWGKSAVYWAATAIRRAEGAGPTLVVSPLLSLMRDQVAAAARAGLRAATLNSSNIDAWSAIEVALRAGDLDVLLVSPERLANPGFGRRVLDGLAGRLGLVVIDEAHAVSDWGHDFRPDYRRVSDVLQPAEPGARRCWRRPRPRTNGSPTTSRSSWETRRLCCAAQLARSSLELSVVDRLTPARALRLGGRPPAAAARLRHRLHDARAGQPRQVVDHPGVALERGEPVDHRQLQAGAGELAAEHQRRLPQLRGDVVGDPLRWRSPSWPAPASPG